MTVIEDMNWRYAVKVFDSAKKVPQKDLDELLEVLRLSPSSFGLQPWKFLLITDSKIRAELRKNSWDQPKVTDASQLIVLCARTDMNEAYVHKFVKSIAETRGIPVDALKDYQGMMLGSVTGRSQEDLLNWSKKQVYISLGTLLTACAVKRIDACPMEGFDATAYDKILGLAQKGLTATVVCAVGYRGADEAAKDKKVRFPKSEVITEI
ncbi:MAG: NAD(P)H-dependent oxidoreductase [Candidatus Micrarchaeota archaeon]|nr:NAD(P)H-dependent oxidoreductase [Candidatus Micrarchaeota archaeon]